MPWKDIRVGVVNVYLCHSVDIVYIGDALLSVVKGVTDEGTVQLTIGDNVLTLANDVFSVTTVCLLW